MSTSCLGGIAAFGGDDPGGGEGKEVRVSGSRAGSVVLRGDVEREVEEGESTGGEEG